MQVPQRVRKAGSKVRDYAEEKAENAAFNRVDSFIADWEENLSPEDLRTAIKTNADPLMVFDVAGVRKAILDRVPFFLDKTVVDYATKERIEKYMNERLSTTAPQLYAIAAYTPGGIEYLANAVRAILKDVLG